MLQFNSAAEHTHRAPENAVASFEVAIFLPSSRRQPLEAHPFVGPAVLDGESLKFNLTGIWSHAYDAARQKGRLRRICKLLLPPSIMVSSGPSVEASIIVVGKFQRFVVRTGPNQNAVVGLRRGQRFGNRMMVFGTRTVRPWWIAVVGGSVVRGA